MLLGTGLHACGEKLSLDMMTNRAPDFLESLIHSATCCNAKDAQEQVPDNPGYYAIFLNRSDKSFPAILRRQPQLEPIYIGIAKQSLLNRLVHQDLRHRGASSFFRSLGAVLGFRPPIGSLCGLRNKCNYKFSLSDTHTIVEWINENLSVRWLVKQPALIAHERAAIQRHRPLLNITHNPTAASEVKRLRLVCRNLARQAS